MNLNCKRRNSFYFDMNKALIVIPNFNFILLILLMEVIFQKFYLTKSVKGDKNVVHNMKMTDKLVFRLLKIYRGFYDKTALNFILYTIHSFYIGKMCISVFYFMFLPLDDCQKIKLQIIMSSVLNLNFVFLVDNSYQVYENSDYSQ